jgi:ParB family chromosome partitioning protein
MNRNKKKFDINDKFENIFESTEPMDKLKGKSADNISIEKLVPFKNHPFKLYEGKRFTDMIESVKINGIIVPVIVRPLDSEKYEILSGHNRVEAAKVAGLEAVPVIVRENLSDDEALLIVTETNLVQRSFTDLAHSERAVALKKHMEAIKQQGKRNDLINEINELLNADATKENITYAKIGTGLKSRDKVAAKYGLTSHNVSRYIRLSELNESLLNKVDNEQISFNPAVSISYLLFDEQAELNRILEENKYKIDMKKAELLREYSKDNKLTPKMIEDILSGIALKKKNRASLPVQSLKIGGKMLSKYFKPGQDPEEIQAELFEALEFYRAHK